MPILPAWQCSCKERRKQSALARCAKVHPAREASVRPARLACTQSRIVHGKIPSPACGGRGSHEKNARIFFMGTREGGRRLEGGNTKPGFIPLGGRPQTPYLSRLAATHKLSIHPAWRPLTNPVFIPLGGHSQAQYLSRLARTQSRIVHGKIPSPACGVRWPQTGRGEYKTSVYPA